MKKEIKEKPESPTTEIWIANNVVISCCVKYNWFNKLMLKVVFGWKVKEIKKKR